MKRLLVVALEHLCGWFDAIPWAKGFGCYPLRISTLAVRLDERWGTGVWE